MAAQWAGSGANPHPQRSIISGHGHTFGHQHAPAAANTVAGSSSVHMVAPAPSPYGASAAAARDVNSLLQYPQLGQGGYGQYGGYSQAPQQQYDGGYAGIPGGVEGWMMGNGLAGGDGGLVGGSGSNIQPPLPPTNTQDDGLLG